MVRKLHAGFGGRPNLESVRLTVEENSTSHLFWPVWTCPQYSDHVHSSRTHFLHFWMLLFFSLTSYSAEIAYFSLPTRELSIELRYWRYGVSVKVRKKEMRKKRNHIFPTKGRKGMRKGAISLCEQAFLPFRLARLFRHFVNVRSIRRPLELAFVHRDGSRCIWLPRLAFQYARV